MRRAKIAIGFAALAVIAITGWQIGASELANIQLRESMQDLAAQAGTNIGLTVPKSDEDFRNAVVKCARQYEIELTPEQVSVLRRGAGITAIVYFGG